MKMTQPKYSGATHPRPSFRLPASRGDLVTMKLSVKVRAL